MIEYLKGDAVYPSKYDPNKMNLILQINNDIGAYGAGFSGALSKRWPEVENKYREWYKSGEAKIYNFFDGNYFELGSIQLVNVSKNLSIVNMIAQHGIGKDESNRPAIRYDALDQCLSNLKQWIFAAEWDIEPGILIHLPRIGAGLAGGKWSIIEALLNENLGKYQMYIYDL